MLNVLNIYLVPVLSKGNTVVKKYLPSWSLYSSREDKTNNNNNRDFPGGAVVKNPPANAGDTGSIPGLGRSHMPQSN